jgi:uncharacterized membrane protein
MTQVINSEDNNISKKANTSTQVSLSEFSGPIPPPSVLSLYKDVDDSFAERIFTMAEKQMAHRHTLETQSLDTEIEQIKLNANLYKRGQLFAFIIGIFTIGIGGGRFNYGCNCFRWYYRNRWTYRFSVSFFI